MLRLGILYTKPLFKRDDNEILLDLTLSSIKYTDLPRVTGSVLITREYQMRPDLVAKGVIGDDTQLDLLLKYNGISNPYSIEEGQILYVPDMDDMNEAVIEPRIDEGSVDIEVDEGRVDTDTGKTEARKKRMDLINKKKENDATTPPLPPNVATAPGVTFEDGQIIFGTNVTGADALKCRNPSAARAKQQLLNKSIYGK